MNARVLAACAALCVAFALGGWVGYRGGACEAPAGAQAAPQAGAVLPGGAHLLPREVGKVGVNVPKPPRGTPGTVTGYTGVTVQPEPRVPAGLPAECAAVTCGPVDLRLWQVETRNGTRVVVDAGGAEVTGGTSLLVQSKPIRPWAAGVVAEYDGTQWQPGAVVQRTFWQRIDVGASLRATQDGVQPGVQVLWRF